MDFATLTTPNKDFFKFYPSRKDIDEFIESIYTEAKNAKYKAEIYNSSCFNASIGSYYSQFEDRYVKFECENLGTFYALWQLSGNTNKTPLAIHLPGYGHEVTVINELTFEGYNILSLMPMGYNTPETGLDFSKVDVLPKTILTNAKDGYRKMLIQCAIMTLWAMQQNECIKERVSFIGTSQGGGLAVLMGSIFSGRGTACVCADEPFLTNFPNSNWKYACIYGAKAAAEVSPEQAYHAVGFVDTLSHTHRINFPIMMTAGTIDDACPPEGIKTLYDNIDSTKLFMSIKGRAHRHTREFIHLAKAWLRMYA